jgi:predicted short-subunit dehydrogenase-like oxidoreductase (DUF2520 family)
MDIVIIGTGNTATILGKRLKDAGHRIVQVFGRNAEKASELAYDLDSVSTNYSSTLNKEADLYLIAVSDNVITEVLEEIVLPSRTVVHTAASVSKDILKPYAKHYGVFYPLQSLKKGVSDLADIPIVIDASDPSTRHLLQTAGRSISNLVLEAGDEQRLKLHLAAVFCNNFVNHIYTLMEHYCAKESLDFRILIPLIQETSRRLSLSAPGNAQTGPAVRRDTETLNRHLSLLDNQPHLKEIYRLFTESIQQYH